MRTIYYTPNHVKRPRVLTANKPRKTSRAPNFPPIARPYTKGLNRYVSLAFRTLGRTHLPISTPFAPRLNALMISTPVLMPLSNSTVRLSPTASTISGSTSKLPMAPSSCRPPWLLTTIPSIPAWTAIFASSTCWIPFRTIGPSHSFFSSSNCSHV